VTWLQRGDSSLHVSAQSIGITSRGLFLFINSIMFALHIRYIKPILL